MRILLTPLILLLVLSAAGCGKRTIVGKVVYKGDGTPVPSIVVMFEGVDPANGVHMGFTDESGNFTLSSVSPPIVQPGDYRVGFYSHVPVEQPDGDAPLTQAQEDFILAERIKVVPKRFLDPRTSGLICNVTPDKSFYILEVDRP